MQMPMLAPSQPASGPKGGLGYGLATAKSVSGDERPPSMPAGRHRRTSFSIAFAWTPRTSPRQGSPTRSTESADSGPTTSMGIPRWYSHSQTIAARRIAPLAHWSWSSAPPRRAWTMSAGAWRLSLGAQSWMNMDAAKLTWSHSRAPVVEITYQPRTSMLRSQTPVQTRRGWEMLLWRIYITEGCRWSAIHLETLHRLRTRRAGVEGG